MLSPSVLVPEDWVDERALLVGLKRAICVDAGQSQERRKGFVRAWREIWEMEPGMAKETVVLAAMVLSKREIDDLRSSDHNWHPKLYELLGLECARCADLFWGADKARECQKEMNGLLPGVDWPKHMVNYGPFILSASWAVDCLDEACDRMYRPRTQKSKELALLLAEAIKNLTQLGPDYWEDPLRECLKQSSYADGLQELHRKVNRAADAKAAIKRVKKEPYNRETFVRDWSDILQFPWEAGYRMPDSWEDLWRKSLETAPYEQLQYLVSRLTYDRQGPSISLPAGMPERLDGPILVSWFSECVKRMNEIWDCEIPKGTSFCSIEPPVARSFGPCDTRIAGTLGVELRDELLSYRNRAAENLEGGSHFERWYGSAFKFCELARFYEEALDTQLKLPLPRQKRFGVEDPKWRRENRKWQALYFPHSKYIESILGELHEAENNASCVANELVRCQR